MAQQKQREQPILIDGKNIFTYCFQPIQRLQPNFTTDGTRNFLAQQKPRKQFHLTDGKNISLTVSNQCNACNLILRLMPQEISCIPSTTETTQN